MTIDRARRTSSRRSATRRRRRPRAGFRAAALHVVPLRGQAVGSARRPLLILLAAVVLVLLIACANIANLLLARASARQREIAIRTAVGAGRGRVLRQFLVESLILAAAGGALGPAVRAGRDLQLMMRLIPQAVPRLAETSIDGHVLAFTAARDRRDRAVFGFTPAIALLEGRASTIC